MILFDRQDIFNLLLYYKCYPQHRQLPIIRFDMKSRDRSYIIRKLHSIAADLAPKMTDVKEAFDARWGALNTLHHYFGPEVRASLDSFPIYVRKSKDSEMQTACYNGKYGKLHIA